MSDIPSVFRAAVASRGPGGQDDVYAKADYTTNTLYVHVPADDPVGMTLIHAFTSREEFMHGEWNVGIILSSAQLELAGIDALFSALSAPDDMQAHIDRLFRVWGTATRLDRVLGPFQEAVDKLQVLSVVAGEAGYYRNIERTFDRVFDDQETAIDERLDEVIATQRALARGKRVPGAESDNEDLYVNPLYYYALLDAAVRHGRDAPADEGTDELRAADLSAERTIAEAVARAALDIPNPIAPLGTDEAETATALSVGAVETPPLSLAQLRQRYDSRLSADEYDRYLLDHADAIEDTDLRETVRERFAETGPTWLDAALVCTLRALDGLAETLDRPVADLQQDALRERLVQAVHGVDPDDETTMLQFSNPLLAVPKTAAGDAPDHDLVETEADPFAKVLLEAFEQHGAFGAVVYVPADGDLDYTLNHHVSDDPLPAHPTVPDGIETYRDLWHHYYLGKYLVDELLRRRDTYREAILDRFHASYDSVDALVTAMERTDASGEKRGPAPAEGAARAARGIGDELAANVDAAFETVDDDPTEAGRTLRRRQTAYLDRYTTAQLEQAAEALGLDPPSPADVTYDRIPCPFCPLVGDPCGEDACLTAETRDRVMELLPRLVGELVRCERVYL